MTENVRKVFNMLGVEPNERFKSYDREGIIVDGVAYLDEELIGYQIVTGEETYVEDLLSNILNGLFTIIKLPKKKHVGDLQCEDADCKDCPLYAIHCFPANDNLYNILEKWLEVYEDKELYEILKARLDKEVEE